MLVSMIESGTPGPSVQLPVIDLTQFRSIKPCHAGIKFGADGVIYSKQPNGNFSAVANWLLVGSASGFWISRTIDSGVISTDAGAGPLQMNTDREFSNIEATFGDSTTGTITFNISNDVSGSPIVESNQYVITATLI